MQEHTTNPEGQCQRCGACCLKGGPALHGEDQMLFTAHGLRLEDLVTIRKGEHVLWPDTEVPARTDVELVKLKGMGGEWRCRFYGGESPGCSIYNTRPLECRLFKCWSPEGLREMIGQNTLRREDLLPADHPLQEYVRFHERECPVDDLMELARQAKPGNSALSRLQQMVQRDLKLRFDAMEESDIAADLELFLFGRPGFILLAPLGFTVQETSMGISVQMTSPRMQQIPG